MKRTSDGDGRIWAVLNVLSHELAGPFASAADGLAYIGRQSDPSGLTLLPFTERTDIDPHYSITSLANDLANRYPEQKIQAIKELREATGLSLKDAKEEMERAYRELPF